MYKDDCSSKIHRTLPLKAQFVITILTMHQRGTSHFLTNNFCEGLSQTFFRPFMAIYVRIYIPENLVQLDFHEMLEGAYKALVLRLFIIIFTCSLFFDSIIQSTLSVSYSQLSLKWSFMFGRNQHCNRLDFHHSLRLVFVSSREETFGGGAQGHFPNSGW